LSPLTPPRGREVERASLRNCRLAIERTLLLAGAARGRARALTELVIHAEVQYGEGIAWLLEDAERLARTPAIHLSGHRAGVMVVDCGGAPSIAVAWELADVATARALSTGRAIVLARGVERPHLLDGIAAIAPRRGVHTVSAPIAPAAAAALAGAAGAHASAGYRPVDALLVSARAAAGDRRPGDDLASLVGSEVIAAAVRDDLWLDRNAWHRLQAVADEALMPESERSQLDTGIVPPGVDEAGLL
jgi:hypothetical protein